MTTLFEALGWAVLHLLWQAAVIWIVWRVLVQHQSDATARYHTSASSLLAIGVLFCCTALFYRRSDTPALVEQYMSAVLPTSRQLAYGATSSLPVNVVAWIGAIWIVATCVALVRLAVAWRRSQEAYSHTAIPAPRSLVEIANSVARHLGLRSAPAVRECDSIDSPAVLGAWGAMVVFPMRGLEHLSESQLRGIVAHELMHVRRRDGMTNLVQCVLDAVVWFHPAARDISGAIRIEREKICDSFGARVCGDAREYVHGLVQLEESRAPDAQLVLAARHGALLDRAQHLLVPRRARGSAPGYVAALVIGLTVGLSAALAWPSAALAGAVRTAPREFTVQGRDRAGEFSLTIRSGRAVAARINGAIVPAGSILQKHDSVYVLDLRGLTSLAVRVKPSGITWAARKPTH